MITNLSRQRGDPFQDYWFFFIRETYLNFCNVSNSKTSENVHDNKMADKHHGHQDNEEIKFISTEKRLVYLGQITRVELSSHKGQRLRNRLQIDENKKITLKLAGGLYKDNAL